MIKRRINRRQRRHRRLAVVFLSVAMAVAFGGAAAKAEAVPELPKEPDAVEIERNATDPGDLTLIDRYDRARFERMTLTAYCPCEKCCSIWSYLDHAGTACGARAKEGVTVAMGPDIPFWTEIYIDGVGWRICQDRGSAIGTGRIDVYFESHEDALAFGMKDANVLIWED